MSNNNNIYPIIDKYILDTELLDFCTSTNGISILHVNCRSLKKHFFELQILLNNCVDQILAMAISESWMNKLNENIFQISGYNLVSNCRNTTSGGVGIYIDSKLN